MKSGVFKNKVLIILIICSLSFINSCGFFRSIGLYNVPPDYADTFKEVNGRDFINHGNITANLLVELTPLRYKYSPYDTVEMKVKIVNVSTIDTMYISEPRMFAANYPSQGIVVTDTAGKRMRVLDYIQNVDGPIFADKYGRKIRNTLAPDGYKLPPGDSVKNIIRFVCGKNNLALVGEFERENEPGYYTAYYTQSHEEYDRIKGLIKTRLLSNKVHFRITDYTEEQIKVKDRVQEIITALEDKSDSLTVDKLFINFKNDYPESVYTPQLQNIIRTYHKIFLHKQKDD